MLISFILLYKIAGSNCHFINATSASETVAVKGNKAGSFVLKTYAQPKPIGGLLWWGNDIVAKESLAVMC